MAERTPVQCKACAKPYSARSVEGDIILPTNDGKCVCGSDELVVIEIDTNNPKEAARGRDAEPTL